MGTQDTIQELITCLRGNDGVRRERARKALVQAGKPAVGPLLELLSDRDQHVRWEACKALGSIKDPVAAVPLVGALKDDNVEIQWLAAEALIAPGRKAIIPLLKALQVDFDSVFLRQGAHHVLHALEREDNQRI